MRVVIVEDNALLREGIVALLRERSIDVVAQAEDAPGLLRIVAGHKPDVAIVDVRLPPTFTDDGVRAAIEARAPSGPGRPDPVAVRRTGLHVGAAGVGHGRRRLPAQGARGGGAGVRRGDRARRRRWHRAGPRGRRRAHAHAHHEAGEAGGLGSLTPREREVLALMAEGRTNNAIARELVVTSGAVEKHVSSIFGKLSLPASNDDHRRVLAVLAFLRAGS